MIDPDKLQSALRALNFILTRARTIAYEAQSRELGDLLDAAEILPKYIAEADDRTTDFRTALKGIAQTHRNCSYLVDLFDDETGQGSW